ncbi:hypothetical protein ABT160_34555 [Streptomyces sp. NPDC001941]|uniref:hypothetical protein n=1 Tax=Streptomyces sp. NPDC001941 TaxID=3154659 RepID=UPI00332395E2
MREVLTVSSSTTVLEHFPAGDPRGSWPAERYAADLRAHGTPARVVMDLDQDAFLVVVPTADDPGLEAAA